jgi:hypothetical protein
MGTVEVFSTGLNSCERQKQERLREIIVEGFRRKIAIFVPSLRGPIYLGLCALRDAHVHGYLA